MVCCRKVNLKRPSNAEQLPAGKLASEWSALRLTPDEWMIQLFGREQPAGKRNILERRFIWLALSTRANLIHWALAHEALCRTATRTKNSAK